MGSGRRVAATVPLLLACPSGDPTPPQPAALQALPSDLLPFLTT